MIVQKDFIDTGVASTSGTHRRNQTRREKSNIQAPVNSSTPTESNSGHRSQPQKEAQREMQSEIANRAHRAPSSSQGAGPQRFVPPRPNAVSTPARHPQIALISPRHNAKQGRKSPERRVIQSQHVHSQETQRTEASHGEEDTAAVAGRQRHPGMRSSEM